jgi:hypothetical protein
MIKSNHRTILRGFAADYIPVGVFETHEEADHWLYYNRHKFENIEPA